jgi:hypothetical protein
LINSLQILFKTIKESGCREWKIDKAFDFISEDEEIQKGQRRDWYRHWTSFMN